MKIKYKLYLSVNLNGCKMDNMDNLPKGLDIIVHRGKYDEIERKSNELVKNRKFRNLLILKLEIF